jgi:hypothetical protein
MKRTLRTLALSGIVAAAAVAGQAQAQAQVVAVRVGPVAPVYYDGYVPPCPGVDFIWTPGYYAGSVWVPGRWVHRDRFYVEHREYRDYHFDHRGWDHGRR